MLVISVNGSVVEILDFLGPVVLRLNILWGT